MPNTTNFSRKCINRFIYSIVICNIRCIDISTGTLKKSSQVFADAIFLFAKIIQIFRNNEFYQDVFFWNLVLVFLFWMSLVLKSPKTIEDIRVKLEHNRDTVKSVKG